MADTERLLGSEDCHAGDGVDPAAPTDRALRSRQVSFGAASAGLGAAAVAASADNPASWLDAGFFVVGMASDITFNTCVLSVEYLRTQFGSNVLVIIGQAQFWGSTLAMLALFALGLQFPALLVQNITGQSMYLLALMTYMAGVNILLLLCAVGTWRLSIGLLQVCMFMNGIATGASQGLGGRLSGFMTKFGSVPTAASAQMSGVGFGIAFPTVLQLSLMPFNAPAPGIAVGSYFTALVGVVCGMVGLVLLSRTSSFRRIDEAAHLVEEPFRNNYRNWATRRLHQVAPQSAVLVANFSTGVYLALLTTRLPAKGALPLPDQLPTLLIGVTNACDFLGRFLTLLCLQQESESELKHALRRMLVVLCAFAVRFCIAILCVAYGLNMWSADSNAFILSLYACGAVLGGTITVATTQSAQTVCMRTSGPSMDQMSPLPCPLAGQIMFLACISGCLIGTMLPYPTA